MESKALQRLELFVENTQEVKKGFIWQNTLLKRLAALLYAAEDRKIDLPAIRECHELIKRSTGLFSSFRGSSAMTVATLLSLRDNPTGLFSSTLKVYEAMKQANFRGSDYLVIAAYQIAANASEDKYEEKVERARAFYDGMKNDHRFLTGRDDYIFSAMLGLSDIEVTTGVERMERLFQSLRPEFHTGTGVQALTQVLVLGGDGAGIETRVLTLRDALRSQGLKLDRAYTLSSLGVLSLLPLEPDAIVRQVAETSELLRSKKGFGFWSSVTKQELLLLSAGLVALNSVDQIKRGILDTALSTSMINIIIAQQAALAAAAAASASAAASSSSS